MRDDKRWRIEQLPRSTSTDLRRAWKGIDRISFFLAGGISLERRQIGRAQVNLEFHDDGSQLRGASFRELHVLPRHRRAIDSRIGFGFGSCIGGHNLCASRNGERKCPLGDLLLTRGLAGGVTNGGASSHTPVSGSIDKVSRWSEDKGERDRFATRNRLGCFDLEGGEGAGAAGLRGCQCGVIIRRAWEAQ